MTKEKEFGVAFPLQIIDTLNDLSSYGDFVELKLLKEVQVYEDMTRKYNAGDFFSRPKKKYGKDFVNLSRMSLLNSIYAYTEFLLKQTCFDHADFLKKNIKFSEIQGDGDIMKTQNYLKGYDVEHFNQYCKEFLLLDKCRLIRNTFAHNGGNIKKLSKGRKKNLLNAVRYINSELGKECVEIEPDIMILGESFCEKIIENNIRLANGIAEWANELENR